MAIPILESPLHLRKRLRAAFSPATMEEQLIQLKEEANTSLMALEYLNETPCLNLVRFYQIVSHWCDRGNELRQLEHGLARIDYRQYTEARQALLSLAAQEERNLYTGQVPSMETTLLGNRCGLFTKTVAYWEANRAEYTTQPAIIGQPQPTVMALIDNQAERLLDDGLQRWHQLLQDLIDS